MNEKRIQEVMEVEKQALDLVAQANRDAEQLPHMAEVEAAAMIKKSRSAAEDEARKMIQAAQGDDDSAGILAQSQEKMNQTARLGEKNFEAAVSFVLARVLGRA